MFCLVRSAEANCFSLQTLFLFKCQLYKELEFLQTIQYKEIVEKSDKKVSCEFMGSTTFFSFLSIKKLLDSVLLTFNITFVYFYRGSQNLQWILLYCKIIITFTASLGKSIKILYEFNYFNSTIERNLIFQLKQ